VRYTPIVVLYFGLALVTLGMILVVLGVISGGFFLPGVVILMIGHIIIAGAGIFGSAWSDREPA
jgi:hypothetical protein